MNTQAARAATPAPTSPAGPVPVEQAEAALVEHYPRLVRLAYVTLPAGLGRHHRAIAAHRLVQRALPSSPLDGRQDGPYGALRLEVLKAAMAFGGRGRIHEALEELRLPRVLGLRLNPRAGGEAEAALLRALGSLPTAARAAYVLLTVEQLPEPETRALLDAAGAPDPREAVRAAAAVRVPAQGGTGPAVPPAVGDLDPCTVHLRPTDLLRRRKRARIGAVATAVVAAGAVIAALTTGGGSSHAYTAAGAPGADPHTLDPAALVRVPAGQWKATARMDFSAWPARGNRVKDTALLRRALEVWAAPGSSVTVSATPGTPRTGPTAPPQLLFAGDEDEATVVIFYDGVRIVRYAQPRHGSGGSALDFAQVQNADLATSAALLVDRVDGNARFLTAPWITAAQTRDLLAPDRAATALHRAADGVTDPVPMPDAKAAAAGSAACGSTWPVLELHSSPAIGAGQSFLLSDLGDLAPVHLTYTPAKGKGPAAAPLEATGQQALASWAHSACRLGQLRGQGVRSVNSWQFARTPLPEGAGDATWTCDRADTWRGPGVAFVQFVPPAAKPNALGALAGQQANGNACSRFSPHVMAGVMWKSPATNWYLLAAGSSGTASLSATNGVDTTVQGRFLAVQAPRGTRAKLSGRLADGTAMAPLNGD